MDVYEKPTGRSAWLLGLVALRELLIIGGALTFPSDMGRTGHVVFRHLHQARLPNPRFSTQQDNLSLTILGLLPTLHEERDLGFPTHQRGQTSRGRNVKAAVDPTVMENTIDGDRLSNTFEMLRA